MEAETVEAIVRQVVQSLRKASVPDRDEAADIPIGVSNRHIHLSAAHAATLFGCGSTLTHVKDLKQVGEFAAAETVTLVGPKGILQNVRVLGPLRETTQIEISRTDGFALGIRPPVRNSGDIGGSAGLTIIGPYGVVTLPEGVICAARHIHMSDQDAACFGVKDGDRVEVETSGPRATIFKEVLVRVKPNFRLEMHVDTDEANAADLKQNDMVRICRTMACTAPCRAEARQTATAQPVQAVPAVSIKKKVLDAETMRLAAAGGVKKLAVPAGTLVTPLARDLARELGVALA